MEIWKKSKLKYTYFSSIFSSGFFISFPSCLPYFPYHFTIQPTFLPYFPNLITSENIWKIGKKRKLDSEIIWKIQKKIVKRCENNGRKVG
jgi:hypothetical protein